MTDELASLAQEDFEAHVARDLLDGQKEAVALSASARPIDERFEESFNSAREVVNAFRPVPQIIWRICHYVMGWPTQINKLSEGSLFGLKRIILAIGNDRALGGGKQFTAVREVVEKVPSDVIAAAAVIYAVSRRLQARELKGVWGPILDDAILRAHIGFLVGALCEPFGAGRGMLAGFAGRIGLATLLATGTPEQAGIAMSGMSSGQALDELAYGVYGSAPLHVAGMTLMAAGCGRDALLGVGAYGMSQSHKKLLPPDSKRWLDVFSLIERLRADSGEAIPAEMWAAVGSASDNSRQGEVSDAVQNLIRTGHGWGWLL